MVLLVGENAPLWLLPPSPVPEDGRCGTVAGGGEEKSGFCVDEKGG